MCAGMTVSVMSVTKKMTEEANKNVKAGEEVEEIRSDPDAERYMSCSNMFTIVCCYGCNPMCLLYHAALYSCKQGTCDLNESAHVQNFKPHLDNVMPNEISLRKA